ncbi:MAG: hypothetical protein ACF8PN_05550 [Phycisphaerales bacterium]
MRHITTILIIVCTALGAAAPTFAQVGELDQVSPLGHWAFPHNGPWQEWQQQVRAGMSGQLEGVELRLHGSVGDQLFVEIRRGETWTNEPPLYSGSYTKTTYLHERVFFDMTDADIRLDAGEVFVIHTHGISLSLNGNRPEPGEPPLYPEPLYLNGEPHPHSNGLGRFEFYTYMLETDDRMSLTVNGTCPGEMAAYVTDAPPNSRVALLYANNEGNATMYGLCPGLVLGLDRSVRVVDVQDTNANGEVGFGGRASSRACGGYLQAWDYNECLLSNVVPLP